MVVDVETSGLSPQRHRVVELAMVTVAPNGAVVDEFVTRFNPEGPVGPTHIHGIRQHEVASAPFFRDVAPTVAQRLAGAAVVAHNASFDLAFLREEYHRAGWSMPAVEAFCTLEASHYYLPHLHRRTLSDCCQHTGVQLANAHSALGDARAAAGLLRCYLNPQLAPSPRPEDLAIIRRAYQVRWPAGPTQPPIPYVAPTDDAPRWMKLPPKPKSAALAQLVSTFSLERALEQGAQPSTIAYLEKLAEVLDDGVLTAEEESDLADLAEAFGFDDDTIAAANRAFMLALAHEALHDGRVSQAERAELKKLASILDVGEKLIPGLLKKAEQSRIELLSEGLAPLPDWWSLGAPLCVGDRVVFTGCDDEERTILEELCEKAGVLVMSGVNKKTAMLVTDGSMLGQKLASAQELGMRIVSPSDFRTLLRHIQPIGA
ncbi:exonuclease domain-containing protein [Tessaracoccus sp. Y36]